MKRMMFLGILLVAIFGVTPFLAWAVTSTNFDLEVENGTVATHHNLSSTNFVLEGAVEPIVGKTTSTNFSLESGSAFGWYCGDGFIDPDEDCDTGDYGTDYGAGSCATFGFTAGDFACSPSCHFDPSGCTDVPTSGSVGSGAGGNGGVPSTDELTLYDLPTSVGGVITVPFTFLETRTLSGLRGDPTDTIRVNGQTDSVNYYDSGVWTATVRLDFGENTFTVERVSASGEVLTSIDVVINRWHKGDTNGDGVVDDIDLSRLSRRWHGDFSEADFNSDSFVDDYDLSILVAHWGL